MQAKTTQTFKFVFKSHERNHYSYLGIGDFFSRKNLKNCSRSFLIFRGLTLISFQIQCIYFAKRKTISTIEQRNCKGYKNVIFRGLTLISFQIQSIYTAKRKTISTIEQRNCKGYKNAKFSKCNLILPAELKIYLLIQSSQIG